jgi:V/A-type H+-transporting ATPase subunit F
MKTNLALMGDSESIMCFKAAGVDTFGVTAIDAADTLRKLAKSYKVIFITDTFAQLTEDIIKKFDDETYPIIISLPSKDGNNGSGSRLLKRLSEKALGVDILSKEDK